MLSAVSVLTNAPKILYLTMTDVWQLSLSQNDKKYNKSDVVQIYTVFGTGYCVDLRRVFWGNAF